MVKRTGFCGGQQHLRECCSKQEARQVSPEARQRAVRLVHEQRSEHSSMWAASRIGCPMIGGTPQTLLDWINHDEVDRAERDEMAGSEIQIRKLALDMPTNVVALANRSRPPPNIGAYLLDMLRKSR